MKEILNRKGTSGISLVALIVTIIVLIILTAAVIVTFMEGGIIDRAKKAVFRSDIRNYQDILLVKNANNKIDRETGTEDDELINVTDPSDLSEMRSIIPEFKEEYLGLVSIENGKLVLGPIDTNPYRDWLIELGIEAGSSNGGAVALSENAIANKVEVGDYVNYSALLNGGTSSAQILSADSGYIIYDEEYDPTIDDYISIEEPMDQTITRDNTINWRVLSVNKVTGVVTLTSETPIDDIYLQGKLGYLNGPSILDSTYNTLYSVSGVGTARNLRVEDINEIMGYTLSTVRYLDVDGEWHTTTYEKTIGELETELGITFNNRIGPLGEDDDIGNYKLTNYEYDLIDYKTDDNTEAYNVLTGYNGNKSYWLSSPYVCATFNDYSANFGLMSADKLGIYSSWIGLYISYDGGDFNNARGRPIVILNSSVEIGGGDGSVGSPWTIKQ